MDDDQPRRSAVHQYFPRPRISSLLRISFRERSGNQRSPFRMGDMNPFSVSLNELDAKMEEKSKTKIALGSMGEIRALEHQTLKVPYEILNKHFRTAQKNIDREVFHVQKSLGQLDKGLKEDSLTTGRAVTLLDDVISKLSNLKRKSLEGIDEELQAANLCKKRLQHLKLSDTQSYIELDRWKALRMDRMLIDHCLRQGFYETALELSKQTNLEDMANLDVFLVCREIETSLRERDTSKCLAWCHDNKSKLRKIYSILEFRLRKQDFIELIRQNKRIEAVRYAKKHLTTFEDLSSVQKELEHVMGLLGQSSKYRNDRYQDLLDEKKWNHLIQHFREENFKIYQLNPASVFSVTLKAGLSALKTHQCYRLEKMRTLDCPVCSDLLNILAADLPSAHCSQSKLVCKITGEMINENNQPMMLPNGMVYGEFGLKHMALTNGGTVTCPRTDEVFDYDKIQRVFVM